MQVNNIKKNFSGLLIALVLAACSSTTRNQQLVQAAEKGDTPRVEKLILTGADINTTNSMGYTPYMAASTNGHLETMAVLEKAGAKKLLREEE